jgi:hypothetical protein
MWHGELNFEWCRLEGAPSLSSSFEPPVSSYRPLCPLLLVEFPGQMFSMGYFFLSLLLDLFSSFSGG